MNKKLIYLIFFIIFINLFSFDVETRVTFTLGRDSRMYDAFEKLEELSNNEIQFDFDDSIKVLSKKYNKKYNNTKYIDILNSILISNGLKYSEISDSLYIIYPKELQEKYSIKEKQIMKTIPLKYQNADLLINSLKNLYGESIKITYNKSLNTITVRAIKETISEIENSIAITENIYIENKKDEENLKEERGYLIKYSRAKFVYEKLNQYFDIEKHVIDELKNKLYIKYNTIERKNVEKMINDLDVPAEQVRIEVKIFDYNYTKNNSIGLEWKNSNAVSMKNLEITKGANNFSYLLFPDALNLKQIYANSEVIASPSLRIINGETATIKVTEQIPIPVIKQNESGNNEIYSVNYKDVGIILKCSPIIHNSSDEITLKIELQVNSLGAKEASAQGDFYRINAKEVDSKVRLKDNELVAIGGLISKAEREKIVTVPILGDIPIVGSLFKTKEYTPEKSEIVMLIQPTLINDKKKDNDSHLKEIMNKKSKINKKKSKKGGKK